VTIDTGYVALFCRDQRHHLCETKDCTCACHPDDWRVEAWCIRINERLDLA
jgi:hypothetical protein